MNDAAAGNSSDRSRRGHLRAMIFAAQSAAADARSRSTCGRGRVATGISPDSIAGYELLSELHRGGQGVVYRGVQKSTKRTVAIKVLKEGPFAGPAERTRFEREIQILVALQDRRIVAIHDRGIAAGSHYFVMDYIAGQPLDVYVARDLAVRDVLALFVQICEALNVAHLLGIVHRDLKPGNILIDETGAPHVLDFGLAKSVQGSSAYVASAMTATGQFVGSLPWAAPEQVRSGGAITARTDVYSLGVLLYQALTGRFPYSVTGDLDLVLRNVHTAEPVRPRSLRRELDDEVETMVLKCLAKDPERRYESAGALGRDLEHYLRGEPIDAKRDSGWYVLRKALRRYRVPVAVAAGVALLVAASAVSLSILYGRQGVLLREVATERDKALLAESAAEQGRQKAVYESYMANIAAADGAIAVDDGGAALQRLNAAAPALRNWEWRYLRQAADHSIATFHGVENREIRHVSFSPDGRYVGGLSHRTGVPSHLDIHDWVSKSRVLRVTLGGDHHPFYFAPYRFADDERSLSVCSGDRTVAEYELDQGTRVRSEPITGLPSGSLLCAAAPPIFVATGGVYSRIRVTYWNERDSAARGEFTLEDPGWVNAAAMAANGRRFAFGQHDGVVNVCTIAPDFRIERAKAHDATIHGLAFSPDATVLATSAEDGLIKVWRIGGEVGSNPEESRSFRGSTHRVFGLAFSPDGSRLAAASGDKTVRVWNVADGELLHTLRGHAVAACSVAFHPDGTHLASGSYDATLKLWDLSRDPELVVRRDLPGWVNMLNFDPEGARLIAGTLGGAYVLDAQTGRTLFRSADGAEALLRRSKSGDEQMIVAYVDGTIRWISLATGEEVRRIAVQEQGCPRIAVSPSGNRLTAVKAEGGVVTLRDTESGAVLFKLEHEDNLGRTMTFSPDGSTVVTGSMSGELCLWDVMTGRKHWTTRHHQSVVMSIAFTRDGSRLATASDDATVDIYDARTGAVQLTLRPQLGDLWCVAFSPDGSRLAVGGRDRTVRVFDVENGYEVLSLRGATGTILYVAWSPDGRRIAAGSWAREIFIWDAGTDPDGPGIG